MIKFAQSKLRIQYESVDIRLAHIMFALAGAMEYFFNKDIIITSVYRNEKNSVHKYYRGIDFRISNWKGKHFNEEEVDFMKVFCSYYKYGN